MVFSSLMIVYDSKISWKIQILACMLVNPAEATAGPGRTQKG